MFAICRKKARHLVVKYVYVVKFIFVYIFNEILTRMCEIRLNATKIHGDVLDFEKIHFFYFFKFRCFYGCLWSVRSRSGEFCRICLKINEKHEFLWSKQEGDITFAWKPLDVRGVCVWIRKFHRATTGRDVAVWHARFGEIVHDLAKSKSCTI